MRQVMIVVFLVLLCSPASAGEGWKHELGLYGWFSGLEGTIGVADIAEVPVDATFDDLASYVDFAMAGHYEAASSSTVWLADVSYTGLGSDKDAMVGNQTVNIKGDLSQWIIEGGGGWRVSPEVTLLMVGRIYIIDTGATFTFEDQESNNSVSTSWGDIYVGARWAKRLGSKWTVSLRGDIGLGGSDFAWFGQALVGYDLSSHWSLAAAWRILSLDREADLDTADYFKYDVTQNGLGLALAYRF